MRIAYAPLWLAATNCYVVSAGDGGGPGVIIDAPPEPEAVVEVVRRTGAVPRALLLTHGHLDHVGGAGGVASAFGIPAHLHPEDEWLAEDMAGQARLLLGLGGGEFAGAERYQPLVDGDLLEVAGLRFRVLHTPGHTPGHCCLWMEEEGVLFSGDHLFAGSIGRTDLPGGDYAALLRSMAARIVPLPADTDVLPGHGPATTLARELATNPFLQELPR